MSKLDAMRELLGKWSGCKRCPLHERRDEQPQLRKMVFGQGDANADIMFVGEGPGKDEELLGVPFVGQSGGVLDGFLAHYDYPRKNTFIANIVCCRPCDEIVGQYGPQVKDKAPPKEAVAACLPRLYEQIYIVDPLLIVALGAVPLKVLAGAKAKLKDWVGEVTTIFVPGKTTVEGEPIQIPYPCLSTYHPSYLLRNRALEDRSPESVAIKSLKHIGHAIELVRDYSAAIGEEE